MRILVVTSLYPNAAQPHKAPFNRQQIEALAKLAEVRVIAPVPFTSAWRMDTTLESGGAQAGEREGRSGVATCHPTYYFTPKVLRGAYGSFFQRSIAREFDRHVEEARPDVVLGCWAYPDGWATMRLAKRHGLPIVLKIQGSDVLQVGERGVRARRVAEALAGVDAVVAVSAHLAERAIALGAPRHRVRTVYNGVDTARFCPGDRVTARRELGVSGDEPLVTFVGNLVPVKGVDVLIRALGIVHRRGVRFRCVLVGDGANRGAYERGVVSEGIAERVRFAGSVGLDRMPLWHRASDLLVLPSRSEGIPNVLREAQACGTPFVATRVGGVPEIGDAASLVPPNDPEAMAQRIVEFLGKPRYSDDVHPFANGTPPASWHDSATELLRVLSEVASKNGTTGLGGSREAA